MEHVFLIGAKNFGAYGGLETFVNKLKEYHHAHCFKIHVPGIGAAPLFIIIAEKFMSWEGNCM